jgi:glutaconate CoA-transferase subunit B
MNETEDTARVEQMVVAAARLIENRSVLMVGTQWPIIVSLLAKALHAPDITICYEGGVILGRIPDRIPLLTGDPAVNASSVLLGDAFDTLGMVLHGGRADMAILSTASIDRFGNLNTTAVGSYRSPAYRLGGSGGACDFGSLASRVMVVLEHEKKRFPERVDFITTPGYLSGRGSRERAGLRENTGPTVVVSTIGIFGFDAQGEMLLMEHHPDVTVETVRDNVGWDLKVSPDVKPISPPSQKELHVLRTYTDPGGMYLRRARFLDGDRISFPHEPES